MTGMESVTAEATVPETLLLLAVLLFSALMSRGLARIWVSVPLFLVVIGLALGPAGLPAIGPLHASAALVAAGGGAKVGTSNDSVGSSIAVGLGSGVGLGRAVGGSTVGLGTACCVIATIVLAAATADAWIAAGSTVGVAGAQALPATSANAAIANRGRFMRFSLSPGLTSSLGKTETRMRLRAVLS